MDGPISRGAERFRPDGVLFTQTQMPMNPDNTAALSAGFDGDDLLQLEMRIAQRADELSRSPGSGGGTDLIHWIKAEREVLDLYLCTGPAAGSGG